MTEHNKSHSCHLISLLNMKGGVGKTTLAVNLAWTLYEDKKRVLLVDLDPQFNATQYVMDYNEFSDHKKNSGTIADLLLEHPILTVTGKQERPKQPTEVL